MEISQKNNYNDFTYHLKGETRYTCFNDFAIAFSFLKKDKWYEYNTGNSNQNQKEIESHLNEIKKAKINQKGKRKQYTLLKRFIMQKKKLSNFLILFFNNSWS